MKAIRLINFYILILLVTNLKFSYANFMPYVGLDYKFGYTEGKAYWKKILPTNKIYPNVALFSGLSFNRYFSGELGYSTSFKFRKNSDVSNVNMWGDLAPANSLQRVNLRYNSLYLDLNFFYPNEGSLALLASIGVAAIKPKISAQNISGDPNNDPIAAISIKNKIVSRLGLGIQFAQRMFGIRSKVTWERTSKLSFNPDSLYLRFPHVTPYAFKNNYVWSLGIFFKL